MHFRNTNSSISPPPSHTAIPIYDSGKIENLSDRKPRNLNLYQIIREKNHYCEYLTFQQYLFSSKSLVARLLFSLLPPIGSFQKLSVDYHGSLVSIFLLSIALYIRTNKIGFSLPIISLPLLYILIFTCLVLSIGKLATARLSFREVFCLGGYGLFGGTLTLLSTHLSERIFFPTLFLLTGLSSLRITLTLFFRTNVPAFRFLLATPVAIIHVLFPVYLYYVTKRFA